MTKIADSSYKAKATGSVVLGKSRDKGTPFVELYFQITAGEHAGKKVRWTGYFTANSAERTIESLQHCGWTGDDLSEFTDGELHGLDRNEVEIVTETETWRDRETDEEKSASRVQWVNSGAGFLNVQNAMTKDAAETFGEKMKGLVLKMKKKKGIESADDTSFPHGANAPNGAKAQEPAPKKGW